jgi:hypothetical protein
MMPDAPRTEGSDRHRGGDRASDRARPADHVAPRPFGIGLATAANMMAMTGDARVPSRDEHRRPRRLRDFVRRALWAFVALPRVVSLPVVQLVAHWRMRKRRRTVAGAAPASVHAPSAPRAADSSRRSLPVRVVASSRAPIAAKRDPSFSTVRVAPTFSSGDYAATFAALQLPPSAKLLDLVPAPMLCADVFDRLTAAWTAPADAVPRLGILLSFERWAMLRETALAALQPVTARGIRVEVFYEQQASAGHLPAWFALGQVVHDVAPVRR